MMTGGVCEGDVERGWSGGRTDIEARLRWGFIRKVYGILLSQFALTAVISSIVVFVTPVNRFFVHHSWLMLVFGIFGLILICPIFAFRRSHPKNLILLGLFTACESFVIGVSCAFTRGHIVFEALILATTITVGLTIFTFWGVRRGYDFSFLGPFLFASLLMLIVWGIIQAFLPVIPIVTSVYAMIGALVFSGYIVYDTYLLIERFDYDDYVWASLALYIDIVNLFLSLLQLLRSAP